MPSKPPTHDQLLRAEHPERFTSSKSREDNARRRTDQTSIDSKKLYASDRWQRLRRLKLQRDPLCQCDECAATGATNVATDVDHVVSIRDGGECWSIDNLASLSHEHHARKTATETAARRS